MNEFIRKIPITGGHYCSSKKLKEYRKKSVDKYIKTSKSCFKKARVVHLINQKLGVFMEPTSDILSYVAEEMRTDDVNKPYLSETIQTIYGDVDEVTKYQIDSIFIALCGWSLGTIIEKIEMAGNADYIEKEKKLIKSQVDITGDSHG